jgi:hypothetical protein
MAVKRRAATVTTRAGRRSSTGDPPPQAERIPVGSNLTRHPNGGRLVRV